MTQTAAELRAKAAAAEQEAYDSFERCDTDGFISQWAHGLSATRDRTQAEILENGGVSEFWGLYECDRRVKARLIDGKFGMSWLLSDEEADKFGRRFIPVGDNSRVQKKLGLSERKELAPAEAVITGQGYGLSGSAWVTTVRTGDKWGSDATLKGE